MESRRPTDVSSSPSLGQNSSGPNSQQENHGSVNDGNILPNSTEKNENAQEESSHFERKKRPKTSPVWIEFKVIDIDEYYSSMGEGSGQTAGGNGNNVSIQPSSSGWSEFAQFVRTVENVQPQKSELDNYLEEGCYICEDGPFDALQWWRSNSLKYRILSRMARDILAIPITTVASEATFSAGSRVIDTYRASLGTLICVWPMIVFDPL